MIDKINREESVEGRLSTFASEISNLKKGQESLEQQLTEGFKSLRSDITAIGTVRAAGLLPQIGLGLTLAGALLGMIYVYMNGQAGIYSQVMATLSQEVKDAKVTASTALSDVNARLYKSQEEKGEMKQTVIDFRARLIEVDKKLGDQQQAILDRINERSKATDEKILLANQLQAKINDSANTSKDESSLWRLTHVKENAYAQGMHDAKVDIALRSIVTFEERQYINTGAINELNWLRRAGQKEQLDTHMDEKKP
jgi:hypothetical protein